MKIKCAEINLNSDTTHGALVVPLKDLKDGIDCAFGEDLGDHLEVGDVVSITITEHDKKALDNLREWDGF